MLPIWVQIIIAVLSAITACLVAVYKVLSKFRTDSRKVVDTTHNIYKVVHDTTSDLRTTLRSFTLVLENHENRLNKIEEEEEEEENEDEASA